MSTADELAANRIRRQQNAAEASDLHAEMFELVKRGYREKMPVPDIARAAGVTRGRIYQIVNPK